MFSIMTQSPSPTITMIVAATRNLCIGKDNQMLWHLPKDFQYFKQVTTGHPIIMGRKTFESIGRPLPNRSNIVITRNSHYKAHGIKVVHTVQQAIQHAQTCPGGDDIMIIGGGHIYEQCMPRCHRIYLTEVDTVIDGDAYFPKIDPSQFTCKEMSEWMKEKNLSYRFTLWQRSRPLAWTII